MNRSTLLLLLSLSFAFAFTGPQRVHAQLPQAATATDDYEAETLTRGPLHEAFAEQVNYDPQPGIVIHKPVPEPVDEVPPDVRPEGNNVEWIPGYWGWDDDREDFLWVSGIWRDVPPDRSWVPGYWARVDDGYQWIAGFWNLINSPAVEYLPYPPPSLERGPTSPLPSANYYWVSGCWQYQNQRYLWQPGYWNSYRPGWIWTPPHYNWTPRGAIYIRGYWDYPLVQRGVLFAPVYFPRYPNYQRGYQYSPSVVINLSPLLFHLFVQPGHHHYYWGDYYGDRYRRSGYQPNFAFHGRGGYDPLFNYYNTQQRRQGIDYSSRLRDWHHSQEQHQDQRPPRTLNQQQALAARVGSQRPSSQQLLSQPLREMIHDGQSDVRFRQVDHDQREALVHRSTDLRELSQHRRSNEATDRTTGRITDSSARDKLTERLGISRTPANVQLPSRPDSDRGTAGRVDFQRPDSPRSGSDAARNPPTLTPDSATSGRNASGRQFDRSDSTNRADVHPRGERGSQASPPGQVRSAQPTPRRDLPSAVDQQRLQPRTASPSPQAPSLRPSFSNRQPDNNTPGIQSVPRPQPKPEFNRQAPDRRPQNGSAPPQFVPRARPAEPAVRRTPSFQPSQGQGRPGASSAGRSNGPSARSSDRSQRTAPTSHGRNRDRD